MSVKIIQKYVGAKQDGVIGNETLSKFACKLGITRAMTAHFFGNLHHESGGFRIVEESGNYSAKRLLQVFPKYFNPFNVMQYAGNAEAIFNKTYGGRMGNTEPGDGYKFRGRGFMQTTGKYSYERLGKFLGVDLVKNPDLVATTYPLESAIFYFTDNKLWNLVDDISEESIRLIRKRVNGGYNGLDDVRNKVKYYYNLMK
ncbi:MAG TPA: glycoside hydrolase family 19 protein [Ureibacillus sp.]|nr:glycoside hydrolase family 19 protein [Ureibacillus sp.]